MEAISRPGTPLRHRMIEDMRMRKMAERTQEGYIRAVRKLAAFLGRSPDTATVEDLRRFQLHLVDAGTGPVTINATITALKFFFDVTTGQLSERPMGQSDANRRSGAGAAAAGISTLVGNH